MDRPRRLLFTPGDPAGIGPEVVLKAVTILANSASRSITLVGPEKLWETAADRLHLSPPSELNVEIVTPDTGGTGVLAPEVLFSGQSSPEGAELALSCLETAADILGSSPQSTAVVTGPVNKQGLHDAGFDVPGLTEWFARRFEVKTPVMLLVGGRLRVALLSTHLPLMQVTSALTPEGIVERLHILADGLSQRFGIDNPEIAMLADSGALLADAEGFVNLATAVEGVVYVALLKELEDGLWRISLRSRGDGDVQQLAVRYGGGGHRQAAGCTIAGDGGEVASELAVALTALLPAP